MIHIMIAGNTVGTNIFTVEHSCSCDFNVILIIREYLSIIFPWRYIH